MSKATNNDERRRRSLEAGKEILEKYKAEKVKVQEVSHGGMDEVSDEDSFHTDKSVKRREFYQHEGMSSRDITQSSVSMSEGEADGDLEGLAGRVAQLEELLQGKEAIVEALNAEIDHLRADASSPNSLQSQNSSTNSRDTLSLYHIKLQEFEKAVNQRDNLIENLTGSLKHVISVRDKLATQLNSLNTMDFTCKDNATGVNNISLQEKINTLEETLGNQKLIIQKLNDQLAQIQEHVHILEMEKEARNTEIDDYKLQISNLKEQIRTGAGDKNLNIAETLEQQRQYEAHIDKIKQDMQHILQKFATETSLNTAHHQQELKDITAKNEVEIMNIQEKYEQHLKELKDENKLLSDRLKKELSDLESRHAKELSAFQAQLVLYKKTVETLKVELMNRSESQQTAQAELNEYKSKFTEVKMQLDKTRHAGEIERQKEKEMLDEQIKLHKLQLEDMTSKYITVTALLESKESMERSLEQALTSAATLKEENENLKFKLDDLSTRYSAAQSLIENSQSHERSLNNRIFDLEKSLSRLSGINVSTLSELNETAYQTLDEAAIQYQLTKQKLDEKAEMEKLLVQRIEGLQEDVRKSKEELEQANLMKKSYEKQLKDMKNTCDKYKSELNTLKQEDAGKKSEFSAQCKGTVRTLLQKTEEDQQEIKHLRASLEEKGTELSSTVKTLYEVTEKLKKSEEECQQLKNGLATAWAQCTEVEEKLNQTLALSDSKLDTSVLSSSYNSAILKQFKGQKCINDSVNDIHDQSTVVDSILTNKNEQFDNLNVRALQEKLTSVLEKNEELLKELIFLKKEQADYEEMKKNLNHDSVSLSKSTAWKQVPENDRASTLKLKDLCVLRDCINQLRTEKESVRNEIQTLICVHNEQISTIKAEMMTELRKVQSLTIGVKVGAKELNDLRTELEMRHAKEMEKLRMYFEEKCLSMEKQYSDEIFSQQSKKMSDNDSELVDLTDGIYYGAAGDCLNVSNISEHSSRIDSSIEDVQSKPSNHKSELEYEINIKTLQHELQNKIIEIQELKLQNKLKGSQEFLKNLTNQELLADESDTKENWPTELLELRDTLTSNAKKEMQRLKEEHSRIVARLIDRHQEELNKIKSENVSTNLDTSKLTDEQILEERNILSKTCTTLKGLVEELIKFFAICEEEVNSTLISEIFKKQKDSDTADKENIIQNDLSEESKNNKERSMVHRVHFTPKTTEILSMLNSNVEEDNNTIEKLKQELNNCVRRLKSETAEIVGTSFLDEHHSLSLSSTICLNKVNEELNHKLQQAEELIINYQEEMEHLKMTILDLQRKLLTAENKKETITEGYGENDNMGTRITLQDFSQLQEKARHILSNGGGDCTDLLQLIEELCRQSDKLVEESKKEKEDLQQQIDAADKQLKATRRFLDEQASEREAERDDAVRQIRHLQEQLKEREREKEREQRITSEQPTLSPEATSDVPALQASDITAAVEVLESQMREMSSLMSDTEAKRNETESELKAAIDKIWMLREIITDLEQQLQQKTEKEDALQLQITQLATVIAAQTKNQHELVQELDAVKMDSENKHLTEHINHLQEELRKHKLSSEQFNVNSAALKQMKMEINDMQNQLDKRIKELESAHLCSSNLSLSQPSEDVSIREQIDASRCPTPDDPSSPPMLPLDQLLKLKEKMVKHARVEEVAFKRMRDLEMQVTTLKNQSEELQAEQEILQQTASEQLFQLEAMRGRLEQHKQSAPFAQRQATSRLELQLHEANNKFQSLERTISDKEIELKDMKNQLDRVNKLLQEKEAEITNVVQAETVTIQKLKEQVRILEEEKKILQAQVGAQEHAQLELPKLIDSMLVDKNEEIDHLKEQLMKKEKQIEMYSALNLDETQLRELIQQTETKNSARTLSDILSIHSECEETIEAIRGGNVANVALSNMSTFKVSTPGLSRNMEVSALPSMDISKMGLHVPLLDLESQSLSVTNQQFGASDLLHCELRSRSCSSEHNLTLDKIDYVPQPRMDDTRLEEFSENNTENKGNDANSDKTHVTATKYTQTSVNNAIKKVEQLENQLEMVKEELERKSAILNKRETDLLALQKFYDELQIEFKEVVETLSQDKCFYQKQYELSKASEDKIRKDLMEVENVLKLRDEEVQEHRSKMQVNENIITGLSSENQKLKESIEQKEEEQARKYSTLLQEKAKEVQNFRDVILEKDIVIETIQTRNIEIENENKQLYEFKTKYQYIKQELSECQNEIQRLTEGLNNRDQIIRRLEEMARRSSYSGTSSPSDEKDQEIHYLQEYLKEKDKVIRQMSDDSKSLHKALETIQNKMKESGNVVELRKKLKDEKKLNSELTTIVEKLNKELSDFKLPTQRSQDDTDIEDMVQRELNISAHLDRKIMNAIESDVDEKICKGEKQSSHSELSDGKYMELTLKLSQANKINDELKRLKDDLEIERGMLKCQIAEYEGRIFQLKSDLTEESKKVTKLDEELSSEKSLVRTLKIQLVKEHRAMQSGHVQDSELIAFLQSKLKTSMDNESKLRNDLSLLRQEHKSLEMQLSLMKDHMQSQKSDDLPKVTDLLETERKKYILLMEDFEKLERETAELKDNIRKLQLEKGRLEKQLEVEIEEKEKLISSLALIEGIKDHMQTDLRRTKEELKAREEECEWLQKRIKTMSDAEARRQEQRNSEHNELKGLRREINNARDVMMDLEADMKQSKRELTESLEREMKLAKSLEILKERESELLKALSIAKDDEKKLRDSITELQQDLKTSSNRELELTKELKSRYSNEKHIPPKLVQQIKDLSDTVEKYMMEKTALQDNLIKSREEKEQLHQRIKTLEAQLRRGKSSQDANAISTECVEKLQHFYGKFLRADSRRKALTYQKRYLLTIVGGYQLSEENTLSILAQLTKEQRSYAVVGRNKKSPKVRFRTAVLVLISIHRMKWMILRWNTGKRVGAKTLLWNVDNSFMPLQKGSINHSPPVREKCTSNVDGAFDGFSLEQYYQRLRNIQQTLGLAMSEAGNIRIIPE